MLQLYRLSCSLVRCHSIKLNVNKQLTLWVSEQRFYCGEVAENHQYFGYKDTSDLYKLDEKSVMQHLKRLYNIDFSVSEKAFTRRVFSKFLPLTKLVKNCDLLKKKNIDSQMVGRYLKVLAYVDLSERIKLIEQLPYDFKDVFPLLTVTTSILRKVEKKAIVQRLNYIADLFQVSIIEACHLILYKDFFTIDLETIESRYSLLRSYGVKADTIPKNVEMFSMDMKTLKGRLDKLKKLGVPVFDTSMIHKSDINFKRKLETYLITNGDSTAEYLRKKFNVTPEEIEIFVRRRPNILSRSVIKLEFVINNLFSRGFKPEHILSCPAVLHMQWKKIEYRLDKLNNLENRKNELYRVAASSKLFNNYKI